MLAAIAAVQIADMFDEPEPGKFGPGPLDSAPGYAILGFDVGQVGDHGIGPLQLEKYAYSGILLVTARGKQHCNQFCEVR